MNPTGSVEESIRILLVEDNPGDARLLEAYLTDAAFLEGGSEHVSTLEAAVSRLRDGPRRPDVVLLDLGLPDATGLEAVRTVVAEEPKLPVVVLTGRDDRKTAVEALRAGAEDYLLKGEIGPEGLARSIRYALERKRAATEIRRQERRFRAVITNVSDVISVVAPDGTVRYESPSVERVLGYEPEELEGENILAYFHPEDRDRIGRQIEERAGEPGGEVIGEARFRHANGSWRVLEARGRTPPEGTDIDGVIIVSRDITERVERSREAEERKARLNKILETSADGILLADIEGTFTYANPSAEAMLGLEESEIATRTYRDPQWGICGPDGGDFPDEELPVARVLRDGEPVKGVEHGVERPDGTRRVLSVHAAPLDGPEGELQGVVASLRDVTETRERREALRRSEARYRTLVETMAEATTILDRQGNITFANAEAEELFGLTESEDAGRTYDDPDWRITTPDGSAYPEEQLPFRRVMETGRPVRNVEYGIERPDGFRRVLSINAAPLGEEDGKPDEVVATIRDVTERNKMEKELRHRALHDPLTGLANRSLFRDRLHQALARAERERDPLGLLILDLDRFKQVNDHLGHMAGDRLLEEVARRVEGEVRAADTVARFGGDEFALLLPSVGENEGIRTAVARILRCLSCSFTVAGEEIEIDVTVGGVLACGCGMTAAVEAEDVEEVIRYADIALYRAKETSGPSYHLFDPQADREKTKQLGREQELRRALREEELEVAFQPIVRLEDGDVWGMEPLARWRHPERGLVPPGEFIPLAEETGLIHELGELLLRDTCRQVSAWPSEVRESVFITPNLSGRQFDRESLVPTLVDVVDEAGLDPTRFWIEVTESAVARTTGRVERLREAGFRILVDDFGTGYSSFHYLRDLQLDGLKIDMSFVHGMAEGPRNGALVETMITMGRTMHLITVAEGVETKEQRDMLRDLGCPLGQGFLFARPMSGDEAMAHLAEE